MRPNPFTPVAGHSPPVLAGRDKELGDLMHSAGRLARAEKGDARILMAPRGYGKTALLNAFEDALEESGAEYGANAPRIVSITAADMETVDDMLMALTSPETGRVTRLAGGGFSVGGLGGSVSQETRVNAMTATRHLLRAHPTVLIVDEGSALQPAPARALLNAAQSVSRRRRACVVLVIAGTPGTEHALNRASATFWDESRKTRLDRLGDPDAEEAIAVPLSDCGIRLSATAMAHVTAAAHGYPYFLQVWGEALFDHAVEGGRSVLDERHVEAVRPTFERVRNDLYAQRMNELDTVGGAAALGVARAFRSAGPEGRLSRPDIVSAVRAGWEELGVGPSNVDAAYRDLKHRGFFWQPDPSPGAGYRRGIPSLMEYAVRAMGRTAPSHPSAGLGR